MLMSNKVEAEHNDDLRLRLYWDTTGRSQGDQELQDSLAVLEGQGHRFCPESQENPARTQTEQIDMDTSTCLQLQEHCRTNPSIHNKVCAIGVGNFLKHN